MPAAIDTRRTPLFDAAAALSARPSGISAATHADFVFAKGLDAVSAALDAQTGGCHCVDGDSPVPTAVPATDLNPEEMVSPKSQTNIALVTKAGDRNMDVRHEAGRLELVAPCFSSLVHRTALARGQWMYEVTLQSDGLMQLGWCPPHDIVEWTHQLGVGDLVHSTAYDGHRRSLWKTGRRPTKDSPPEDSRAASPTTAEAPGGVPPLAPEADASAPSTTAEGAAPTTVTDAAATAGAEAGELVRIPHWVDGDIITCCVDLDAGVATYYSNGELTVRTRVPCLATMGADEDPASFPYFLMCPAVTLGRGEMAAVNFGDAPFSYPVAGFAGASWAAHSGAPLPAVLRAHVASEVVVAVANDAALTTAERNLCTARVLARLTPRDVELFGCAVGHTLLRAVSAELSEADLDNWATAVMNDEAFFKHADAVVAHLDSGVVAGPGTVLRHVMVELGYAARAITFDSPSARNLNRRSRAALRLAAHLVTEHRSTKLLERWPHTEGAVLERDLTPFTKPRYATDAIMKDIVPLSEIDLSDPLRTPALKFAAQDLGNDLFLHVHPFRERLFDPLVRDKPWLVVNYIMRVSERQDTAATSGSVLFSLIAACIVRHSKTMSADEFAETYANQKSLLSMRAVRIEGKRLGGPAEQVRRRCKLPGPGAAEGDQTVNVLLIATAWLFHATARRQIPSMMRVITEMKKATKALERATTPAETLTATRRIRDLAGRAVLSRGRIAHEEFVNTLTSFVTLLSGLIHRFGMDAVRYAAPKKSDKNTSPHKSATPSSMTDGEFFFAAMKLPHVRPCESVAHFMLLPFGFVTTTSLALQMLRRSMPFGLARHIETHPELARAAMLVALNPLMDQGDTSEGLHFGSLILEPPCADPMPHCTALAATLTPAHLATAFARCFLHMQNDVSWSACCNLLSCVANASALASERRADGSSSGWLMWGNEVEPSEMVVPQHGEVATTALVQQALSLLHSAQDMAVDPGAADEGLSEREKVDAEIRRSCDFVKGFKALVGRTSWLHSELGVSAQEELMGRGSEPTRQRMSIVFDLLQRNLYSVAFFLDVAGDRLLTDGERGNASANAIVIQEVVELVMLVLRDYGQRESLVYKINEASPDSCKAMHPWRIIAPALDVLVTALRPEVNDNEGKGLSDTEAPFAAWKVAFQRMLTSPRIGWDVKHVLCAAEHLPLSQLVEDKKMSVSAAKLAWYLDTATWQPALQALHDQNVANAMSPTSAKRKKKLAGMSPDDGLEAIGVTVSASVDDFDDETLCSICCVDAVNVKFVPCGHTSCRVCIERQLAGAQKRCFFCNAEVDRIEVAEVPPASPATPAPAGGVSSPTRPTSAALFPVMTPTADQTVTAFPGTTADGAEADTGPRA